MAFDLNPTRNRLAPGSHDQSVIIWDLNNKKVWQRFQFEAQVNALAFNPHDPSMLAVGLASGHVYFCRVHEAPILPKKGRRS